MGGFTVQMLLGNLSSPGNGKNYSADSGKEGKDGAAHCYCIHQYTCTHALLYM